MLFAGPLRADPPSPFTGTWEGEHHGTVYARLVIRDGASLSGRLVTGRVNTYDDGSLRGVLAAEGDGDPIEHVTVAGGRLLFSADGEHIEVRLTDPETAELQFTDLPPGTKLKPFVLKRK